jgi:hypothetical protein
MKSVKEIAMTLEGAKVVSSVEAPESGLEQPRRLLSAAQTRFSFGGRPTNCIAPPVLAVRRPGHIVARRHCDRSFRLSGHRRLHVVRTVIHGDECRPNDPSHEANSFRVNCSSQSEINTYWDAMQKNAGEPQACGWIVNKYGVRRQIVPSVLVDMIKDPDKTKAGRVVTDMQKGGSSTSQISKRPSTAAEPECS